MGPEKASLKRIVKATNLSIATVSRALNEETASMVKSDTREKILNAANKLNYVPNRMARSLRTARTNTFGFLMNFETDAISGYVQEILNGVLHALSDIKYDLKLISAANFDSLDAILKTHALDGLILPHAYKRAFPNLAKESESHRNKAWPVVIINDPYDNYYVNQLYSDSKSASSVLTSYLINRGYKKFYFIGSEEGSKDSQIRKKAFVDVLKKHKIKFDGERDSANGHFQEEGGYRETKALFENRPDFRGAIFCANDAMALGAIRALGELSLRCPQDVAVTGFDGISMGEFSNPPLTTIKFELTEMGKRAVYILKDVSSGKQKSLVKEMFPFQLMERGSCRVTNRKGGK